MNESEIIETLTLIEALQKEPLALFANSISLYPRLFIPLAKLLWENLQNLHFDFLCPTDLSSMSLAIALSITYNIPLIPLPEIENLAQAGQTALLLDFSSSFSSRVKAAAKKLHSLQISVSHAILLLEPSLEEQSVCKPLILQSRWSFAEIQNILKTMDAKKEIPSFPLK